MSILRTLDVGASDRKVHSSWTLAWSSKPAAASQQRWHKNDIVECSLVLGAAGATPLRTKRMEFRYSLGVLHHIPEPLVRLKDAAAVLKPGAPFLVYAMRNNALDQFETRLSTGSPNVRSQPS